MMTLSVEATIPRFTGADPTYPAARWLEDFSDHAEVFGWSPPQKLLMACRALTGVAGLWLRTENVFKTFEELQRALLEEFPYEVNSKVIHELMTNRKKKQEESCYEYMLVMKELGRRGGFPDYVAIEYIVDGIEDYEIHKVMLYGVKTYPDLKEKLKIYEYIKKKMTASATKETSEQPKRQNQKTIEYDSTVATPSGTRCELPMMVVSVKRSHKQQNSECGNQSAKQYSIMFEVRMDEASNRSNDYSKENEVTAIDTKEKKVKKCQTSIGCQTVVNKRVLEEQKEELCNKSLKLATIETPMELKSIKDDEDEELFEEKMIEVEKVVGKEHCTGEFASLKKKDASTRRFIDNWLLNKKVDRTTMKGEVNAIRQLEEKDKQYGDEWMENQLLYKGNEKKMTVPSSMEIEIARRLHESYSFSEKIMKEAISKDYHILR